MKLPKKIDMGHFTFTVSPVKGYPSDREGFKQMGEFNWDDEHITVRKDKSSAMAHTLLHEICHAACLQQQTGTVRGAGAFEETFVSAISNGLSMVIKQNPELMKEIIKALK